MSSCCPPVVINEPLVLGLGPALGQTTLLFVMILGHCAGMCGPLVASFRFGVQSQARTGRVLAATGQLGFYQLGRGSIYAVAGALAGILGSLPGALGDRRWQAVLMLTIAIVLVVSAVFRLRQKHLVAVPIPAGLGRRAAAMARTWQDRPWLRAPLLGGLLALLPCGLPLIALGIAAVSGGWWQGALTMLVFTALTTVPLLPFAWTSALLGPSTARWRRWLPIAAQALSGVWLLLIAGAALGWWPHINFHVFGLHWHLW